LQRYRDRRAVLATMHGKERAIGRPLRAGLGLEIVVPAALDTDRLGTFSGEVERVGSPWDVAIRKARFGMAATGLPFGIANCFGSARWPDRIFAIDALCYTIAPWALGNGRSCG
jgi:hypothetical protein